MQNCQIQTAVASPECGPDSAGTRSTRTKRILVVDDEPLIQRLIGRVLSTEGHSVESAGDGKTAWVMLQDKHYDCIIMDWKMPGLTGRELYQMIRDRDRAMADRCLFISGHAANPEIEELVCLNRNPILIKPFPIDRLKEAVDALLEVTPARQ